MTELLRAVCAQAGVAPEELEPFASAIRIGSDPVPPFDLVLPGEQGAFGLNLFDPHDTREVDGLLATWLREQVSDQAARWWTEVGQRLFAAHRVHGGPAWRPGWRAKIYVSGVGLADTWALLHRETGIGIPTPPAATTALAIDLAATGPCRLRSYQMAHSPAQLQGTPFAGRTLHGVGRDISHHVLCTTWPGPADPETSPKHSFSWIHAHHATMDSMTSLLTQLGGTDDLSHWEPLATPHRLAPVATELDIFPGREAMDALVTLRP